MTEELPEHIQNAKFIRPGLDVDEELWPRKPDKYSPTTKFIQRFRDFGTIMDGNVIEDSIKYGELYTASRNCVAFVNDLGGVAFYIVVTRELNEQRKNKAEEEGILDDTNRTLFYDYYAVTIWPYVYDRDKALDTGRWSTKNLNKIQELANEDAEEHINDYRKYVEADEQ